MTQEEKAKAYDEALERARKMLNMILDNELLGFPGQIREIFPQLSESESEDERIRKVIVKYFEELHEQSWINLEIPDILAWLEKQKDASKAIEAVERVDKYIDEHLANAHDMKDSNPDKKYYRGWDDALGEMARILQDVYSGEKQKEQKPAEKPDLVVELKHHLATTPKEQLQKEWDDLKEWGEIGPTVEEYLYGKPAGWSKEDKDVIDEAAELALAWGCPNLSAKLKSILSHVKPLEWSGEDEKMISTLVSYVEDPSCWNLKCPREKLVAFIESLPKRFSPQPKQELSKEDEKFVHGLIRGLTAMRDIFGRTTFSSDNLDITETINWLKSLRPSWKPSEHQMTILKAVKDYVGKGSGYWGEALGSLIDDLEKLT